MQIYCERVLCDRMLLLRAWDKEANQPNKLMIARRPKGKMKLHKGKVIRKRVGLILKTNSWSFKTCKDISGISSATKSCGWFPRSPGKSSSVTLPLTKYWHVHGGKVNVTGLLYSPSVTVPHETLLQGVIEVCVGGGYKGVTKDMKNSDIPSSEN